MEQVATSEGQFDQVIKIAREASSEQHRKSWNVPFNTLDTLRAKTASIIKAPVSCEEGETFTNILNFFNHVDVWVCKHLKEYDVLSENMDNVTEAFKRLQFSDALKSIEAQEQIHAIVYREMLAAWILVGGDTNNIFADVYNKFQEDIPPSFEALVIFNYVVEFVTLPLVFDLLYKIKPTIMGQFPVMSDVFLINDEVIADEMIHGEMWRKIVDVLEYHTTQKDLLKKIGDLVWTDMLKCIDSSDTMQENFNRRLDGEATPLRFQGTAQSIRPFEGNRVGYVSEDPGELETLVHDIVKTVSDLHKRKLDGDEDGPVCKRRQSVAVQYENLDILAEDEMAEDTQSL